MAPSFAPANIEKDRLAGREVNAVPVAVLHPEKVSIFDQQEQLRDSPRYGRRLVGQFHRYGAVLIRLKDWQPDNFLDWLASVHAGPARAYPYPDRYGGRHADIGQLERQPHAGRSRVGVQDRSVNHQVRPLLAEANALLDSRTPNSNNRSKIRNADSRERDKRRDKRSGITQSAKKPPYLSPGWHALILIILAIIITEGLVQAVSAESLALRVVAFLIAVSLIWLLFFL